MKKVLFGLVLLENFFAAHAGEPSLVQTIPLNGVEGRIDHMSMDVTGKRLFIAALGNNTVEVVDLKQGNVVHSLSGFSEPQGVCFVPEFNLLVVANGGDGRCLFFDGTTLEPVGTIQLGNDADNVRYDTQRKKILIGYGSGAIAVIDPQTKKVTSTIPLSAHPESFQMEASGAQLFVNVPNGHTVSVIDMTQNRVIGSFSLGLIAANFPMALDETNHLLFVACRIPARLLVFDTKTGNKVETLTLHGDCDDVFYDSSRKQVYASCGEGFVDVFTQTGASHYTLKSSVTAAHGGRTSFLADHLLYVAVPAYDGQKARLSVYKFQLSR